MRWRDPEGRPCAHAEARGPHRRRREPAPARRSGRRPQHGAQRGHPPHPWHGAASDEEVRRIVGEDLDRLGQHLTAAFADEHDDKVRAALAEIERGLLVHVRALNEL